jgi:hypothetical protein
MKRIILAAGLLLPATAFAGEASGHAGSPAAGSAAMADADLVGRVTNSHGIRDDVNEYISSTFADDPKKQTAAIRFSQANQRILEVIAGNRPVTQDLVTKISYAGLCLANNLGKKEFFRQAREITARTFDNEARVRAHDDFSSQAHGFSVATSDDVDACEASQ